MFYTAKYESIFLTTIVNKENLMKKLLSIILDEEVKEYLLLSNKLIKDRVKEKGKEVDILVLVDNKIVNIELNSRFDESIKEKNLGYVERIMLSLRKSGGKYKKIRIEKVVQANINFNRKGKFEVETVSIYNETENIRYLRKPIIKNYNVDFYKEMYYNVNRKLTSEEAFFAMLDLPLNELKKLSKEVLFVKEYMDAVVEANEEEFDFTMTKEEEEYYIELGLSEAKRIGMENGIKEGRKEGRKEGKIIGIMQGKIEVAKQMLMENFDIEEIIKITKLDRKKVETLKSKIAY